MQLVQCTVLLFPGGLFGKTVTFSTLKFIMRVFAAIFYLKILMAARGELGSFLSGLLDKDVPKDHQNNMDASINTIYGAVAAVYRIHDGDYICPHDDSYISTSIKYFGQWEKPLKSFALEFIQDIKADPANANRKIIVLDIGANLGTWSVPLAKALGNQGVVYAFEVQREMIMYLNAALLLNQAFNVHAIHAAVSNDSSYLHISGGNNSLGTSDQFQNFGAFSLDGIQLPASSSTSLYTGVDYFVQQITLDDWYQSGMFGSCPDFIKIDVERHELNIFIGAKFMLLECQPILLFEADCGLLIPSIITFLDHLGYSLGWVNVRGIDLDHPYSPGGHTPRVFTSFFRHLDFGPGFLNGGDNIIAVPKQDRARKLSARYPDIVYEIDPDSRPGKRFGWDIGDFHLKFCYEDQWCFGKWETGNGCPGGVSDYLINYWRQFV